MGDLNRINEENGLNRATMTRSRYTDTSSWHILNSPLELSFLEIDFIIGGGSGSITPRNLLLVCLIDRKYLESLARRSFRQHQLAPSVGNRYCIASSVSRTLLLEDLFTSNLSRDHLSFKWPSPGQFRDLSLIQMIKREPKIL